jgi:hypothetical protein
VLGECCQLKAALPRCLDHQCLDLPASHSRLHISLWFLELLKPAALTCLSLLRAINANTPFLY